MSQSEIDRLAAEEAELTERVRELQMKKRALVLAEAERKQAEEEAARTEAEKSKPIEIRIIGVAGGGVITESLARKDVLEVWTAIPGRMWKGYTGQTYQGETAGRNWIPLIHWERTKTALNELPLITITYLNNSEKDIQWTLNAPPFEIEVGSDTKGRKAFIVTPGPGSKPISFSGIPGTYYEYIGTSRYIWIVPITEGWRIPQVIANIEGVVYSGEAKELIVGEVNRRIALDNIAGQKDSSHPALQLLTREVWSKRYKKMMPFKDALEPHQRVGVEFGYVSNGSFILGDDTGTGKTWVMVALAEILRIEAAEKNELYQAVFEVKATNIPKWIREIQDLTGFSPVVCSNTNGKKNKAIGEILVNKAPYILISHDMMGTYDEKCPICDELNTIKKNQCTACGFKFTIHTEKPEPLYFWPGLFTAIGIKHLFVDEAHKIKNPTAHRTYATLSLDEAIEKKVCATASPILNRTQELQPLLRLVNPALFKNAQAFEDNYTNDGRTPKNIQALHEMMRPLFLRRKKNDVIENLPQINTVVETFELSDEFKARYEEVLAGLYRQIKVYDPRYIGEDIKEVNFILAQINRLKQIAEAAAIEPAVELAQQIIDEHSEDAEDVGKKVLIFTHHLGTAYDIARQLGSEAICSVKRTERADGEIVFESLNAFERDDLFESVRNDSRIKYVVTTEASSEGIDLEFCWWIIFTVPFWGPEIHKQCEGRPVRISNPHGVDSFYLVANAKIIRWNYELIEEKKDIIAQAVDGIESSRDTEGSLFKDLMKKIMDDSYTPGEI